MNINFAINQGSRILGNKFIKNPKLDSEILLAKTINKDRNYILLNPNNFLNENDINLFFKLIKQRSLGNPIAYLTNKNFWNSEFYITDDTLIRPDTELIIENVLRLTKQKIKLIY